VCEDQTYGDRTEGGVLRVDAILREQLVEGVYQDKSQIRPQVLGESSIGELFRDLPEEYDRGGLLSSIPEKLPCPTTSVGSRLLWFSEKASVTTLIEITFFAGRMVEVCLGMWEGLAGRDSFAKNLAATTGSDSIP